MRVFFYLIKKKKQIRKGKHKEGYSHSRLEMRDQLKILSNLKVESGPSNYIMCTKKCTNKANYKPKQKDKNTILINLTCSMASSVDERHVMVVWIVLLLRNLKTTHLIYIYIYVCICIFTKIITTTVKETHLIYYFCKFQQ